EMAQARSTYRRPVSPVTATESRNVAQGATSGAPAARFTGAIDATPLDPRNETQAASERPTRDFYSVTDDVKRQRGSQPGPGRDRSGTIIPASHEAAAGPAEEVQTPVDPTFKPQHRDAVEIARLLHESFSSRSKLLDAGPHNLPALQVFDNSENSRDWPRKAAQGVWFTVEIDMDKAALLVTAAEQTTRGLINLMQRLDVPPGANEPATKLVAGTPETLHIGRELKPELERLRQRNLAAAPPSRQVAFQDQRSAPGAPPATLPPQEQGQVPPAGAAEIQTQLPAILGALRSEVTIEALEDLNLLILRGNEQDIQQVMQVIQAIEQLAIGSRPDIHLLFLQHVNSVALAELLTSLYTELEDLRNVNALQGAQSVKVLAVGSPNAILILAPQAAMESILKLAGELDQPGDPKAEIEIFPLRYAVASQAVTLLEDFFTEPQGLEARIRVSADIRTNSLIVHARPNDIEKVRLIVSKIDRGTSKATNRLQVIPLKNAAADELAEFLNTTIQGILNPPTQTAAAGGAGFGGAANQGSPELRETKSVVLEFLARDGNTQRLVRSGLLSDVRVTADLRTNTLTVSAPEQSLELLIELIFILDQPAATVAEIKVFQLENADATTAVTTLTEIFTSDEEDALGIAIAGAEDASSSLIPLKFSTDTRTNSVVAIGGAEALRIVEAILLRLDQSNIRQRKQEVIKLYNSQASLVAQAITEFIQAQLDLIQIDQQQVSTKELIDQTYIVVADDVTNSLIISASPRYYDEIVRIAKKLDSEPPQVMIQAMLVEVSLDDTDEFGIELGFQDPVMFARSLTGADDLLTIETTTSNPGTGIATTTQSIISQGAIPGFLFNNQPLGNNIAGNPSKVGTQGLSNFGLGRTNSELGFGGLVLSASSNAVSVLVRALEARRNARVLSRPQVMALDNTEAFIQLGQDVPVVNGVTVNGLTTSPQVVNTSVGLILRVTPRVSAEGQVVMIVEAQKSGLSGDGVPIFVDANTGTVFESPIIDITLASTTVKVNDGQTVVLGGMIVEEDLVLERKVPWLGDVPLVGQLFRYDANDHRRTELIVFLTPRIVYNDADFELIKQVETERLHFFETEAEAIHGPLFGVPPEAANVPPIGEGLLYHEELPIEVEQPQGPALPLQRTPRDTTGAPPSNPPSPSRMPAPALPAVEPPAAEPPTDLFKEFPH
ncbi:MAG: secretin N-terminal domain-containing protein, partial [Planctomycetaceae bacterium]